MIFICKVHCIQRNQELTQRSANGIYQLGAVGDVSSTFAFQCQNHLGDDKAERDRRGATPPITFIACSAEIVTG